MTHIDLGLGIQTGSSDAITVSLNINDGGMLGRTVRSWKLTVSQALLWHSDRPKAVLSY
jgi:hypothetical protein